MSGKLFLGGVPTRPEVDRLIEEIKATPGTTVAYAVVETVISCGRNTSRFRTVTNAWRNQLVRNDGILTKAEGAAFCFLSADAALNEAHGKVTRVGRATGRLVKYVGTIRPTELSSEEKRKSHVLLSRESMAMLEAMRISSKALIEPAPVTGRTAAA